jgi:hypothetical protein
MALQQFGADGLFHSLRYGEMVDCSNITLTRRKRDVQRGATNGATHASRNLARNCKREGSTTKGGRRLAKLDTQGNACSAAAIGIGGTSAIRESGIEQASGLEYQLRLETFVGLFRPLNWPLKHPALSERPSND